MAARREKLKPRDLAGDWPVSRRGPWQNEKGRPLRLNDRLQLMMIVSAEGGGPRGVHESRKLFWDGSDFVISRSAGAQYQNVKFMASELNAAFDQTLRGRTWAEDESAFQGSELDDLFNPRGPVRAQHGLVVSVFMPSSFRALTVPSFTAIRDVLGAQMRKLVDDLRSLRTR
jgi:hypothetical protein